ncbi:MAG TPA: hypothetical protein VK206_15325 [Anaerolineales bacterium]|nr:hypothetical protein [Anaerolineales bacterium]
MKFSEKHAKGYFDIGRPTAGVCAAPCKGLVISTRLRQSIRRGGTGERHFDGTRPEPGKLLEHAPAPTTTPVPGAHQRIYF